MHTEMERPRFDVWPTTMVGESGSPAATMSRSFDWGNDTSRPALDRAKFLSSVVPRSLSTRLVETKKKRNIITWYSRRVSFCNDCDELIQEWLNGMMELADSVDLPLRIEGHVSLECAVLAHI